MQVVDANKHARKEPSAPVSVDVGLLDGTKRVGHLARFWPSMSDLAVEVDRWGTTLIAAEQAA